MGEGLELSTWLRTARWDGGLSQKELSFQAGVSVRVISDLERDVTKRPYPETIRKLCRTLGFCANDTEDLVNRYRKRYRTEKNA